MSSTNPDQPTGGEAQGPAGSVVSVSYPAGGVALVEIHCPPHNYLDVATLGALVRVIGDVEAARQARVIVLASEGRNFSAGADFWGATSAPASALPARISGPGTDRDESVGPGTEQSTGLPDVEALYRHAAALFAGRLPLVAAVQGGAVGAGLGLACAADFRVAGPRSWFAANFARLGISPGFGLTVTLAHIVGAQRASDMFMTGRRLGGEEAFRIGLCDRLTEAGEEREGALALAGEIATSAPLALAALRHEQRSALAAAVRRAVVHEAAEQTHLWATADWQEGVAAVAERRPPRFRGA